MFKNLLKLVLVCNLCFTIGYIPTNAQTFDMHWVTTMKGKNSRYISNANKVAVDKEGNVFVCGSMWDTTLFGETNTQMLIPSYLGGSALTGRDDIFVAKYDAVANLIWVKKFDRQSGTGNNASGEERGYMDIITDDSGSVYIAGKFSGSIDFDPGSGTSILTSPQVSFQSRNGFVVKLDKDGEFKWVNHITANVSMLATYLVAVAINLQSIKFDPSGNLFIAGYANSSVSDTLFFGDTIAKNGANMFIAQLNPENGKFIRVHTTHELNTSTALLRDMAIDKAGNIYITGRFGDTIDFDPGPGQYILAPDYPPVFGNGAQMFLAKYDNSGNVLWVKKFEKNQTGSVNVTAIHADDSSNVYLMGHFKDELDLDPDTGTFLLNRPGGFMYYNGFIVRLDSAGAFQWGHEIHGMPATHLRSTGIATDAFLNVYSIGSFTRTVNFDPATSIFVTSQAGSANNLDNAYMLKLTSSGDFDWIRHFSGGESAGYSIYIDDHNNVYSTGTYSDAGDSTEFNPLGASYKMNAKGNIEGYVHKLICTDTASSYHQVETCNSFEFNNSNYTATGLYQQKYWSAGGCDSIVTLDLVINHIEQPVINVNNFTLGITGTYYTYQWLKEGTIIPGATDSIFNVSENGNYQVVVTTEKGCTDTSEVYIINNVSVNETESISGRIRIAPNPTQNVVHIQAPVSVNISLSAIDGKIILMAEHAKMVSLKDLSQGIYFLNIYDGNNRLIKVEKIVKQ